jgi:hypothetical protein
MRETNGSTRVGEEYTGIYLYVNQRKQAPATNLRLFCGYKPTF